MHLLIDCGTLNSKMRDILASLVMVSGASLDADEGGFFCLESQMSPSHVLFKVAIPLSALNKRESQLNCVTFGPID